MAKRVELVAAVEKAVATWEADHGGLILGPRVEFMLHVIGAVQKVWRADMEKMEAARDHVEATVAEAYVASEMVELDVAELCDLLDTLAVMVQRVAGALPVANSELAYAAVETASSVRAQVARRRRG